MEESNIIPSIKVSVLMSIYKEPIEWIELSINSILNQTFTFFEFIIINDCPDRKVNRILLKEYEKKDARIVYVENNVNEGLTSCLNKGLGIAKGEYVARMDADDVSLSNRFEKQFNFMEANKDHVLVGLNATLINEKEEIIGERIFPKEDNEISKVLLLKNCVFHPSYFFRKNIIDEHNMSYSEDYPYAEDFDFITRLSLLGKIHNIQEKLLKYRISNQQISSQKLGLQNRTANNIRKEHAIRVLKKYYNYTFTNYDNLLKRAFSVKDNKGFFKYILFAASVYLKQYNLFTRCKIMLLYKYSIIDYGRVFFSK